MKEMIRFSLHRRFGNKATKWFNVLLFMMIACMLFLDCVISFFDPSFQQKEMVYLENINNDEVSYYKENSNQDYQFKVLKKKRKEAIESNHLVLRKNKGDYILYSKYEVDDMVLSQFQFFIDNFHKEQLMMEYTTLDNVQLINEYNKSMELKNKVSDKQGNVSSDKGNVIFMFVTAIYFMMISFVSSVASEVVNEKTTKTLELILTSVSAKTHFYSKLIVGWLVILLQGLLSFSYLLFWFLLRSLYDQGNGLVKMIQYFHLLEIKGNNFYAILMNLDLTPDFFVKLIYSFLFLLIGILFIQLIMVIVSSFVTTIEEAGNIQAPFYLLLLGIYYLVIAINNPHDLTEGIGCFLSYLPLFNMLLMPCRLIIENVALWQLLLSATLSILLIIILVKKGIPYYERGVLDYSNKGLLTMMKEKMNHK